MICRSCSSNKLELILDLGKHIPSNFYYLRDKEKKVEKFPLKSFVCLNCWLVQTKDYIKGSQLFLKDYAYLSGVSQTWHEHCIKFVNFSISKFNLKQKDQILEIASNDGTLLKYFNKHNLSVVGIEPTLSAASIAKKSSIKTITSFFDYNLSKKLKKKFNNLKLIIANNVVAHVDNVNDFFLGISNLSNDKTVISIEFQYLVNLINKNQFDTIYHEHFSYYSIISLKNLVEKFNLKIFNVYKLKTHGGSLRVLLSKKNSKYKISHNVYRVLSNENKLRVNSKIFYQSFAKKILEHKKNFKKFIQSIKTNNKLIYAYGAAAKGNTFLNFMEITKKDIDLILDKNPNKIGKLSPGGSLNICSPDILKNKSPDYILLLAWNLKNEIIKDLKVNYRYKNKFIIAIPKLDIIS